MNKPDFVYLPTGYTLCKDYDLLAKLARTQSVLCVVDFKPDCRDAAHTIWSAAYKDHDEVFQVSARGYGYIHAEGVEDFKKQCVHANLGFVIPNS